jgi:hypothetical protein
MQGCLPQMMVWLQPRKWRVSGRHIAVVVA